MSTKKVTLILPEDLHGMLSALAVREHRSLHGQIIHLLASSVSSPASRKSRLSGDDLPNQLVADLAAAVAQMRELIGYRGSSGSGTNQRTEPALSDTGEKP